MLRLLASQLDYSLYSYPIDNVFAVIAMELNFIGKV
jgi:hypothetical protein